MIIMFYHLQAVCIAVTALLHFFLLTTFFMMFGVGTFFFMNVTVLFYAMRITNNFNSRSRLKWIVGSAIGKLVSESSQYNLTNISLFMMACSQISSIYKKKNKDLSSKYASYRGSILIRIFFCRGIPLVIVFITLGSCWNTQYHSETL